MAINSWTMHRALPPQNSAPETHQNPSCAPPRPGPWNIAGPRIIPCAPHRLFQVTYQNAQATEFPLM